jgi:RNA polymerase sigma factor (sigma-70 family)
MTTDLVTRARAGDSDAFREMTQPHHRELQVHCYRMLGSLQDSEDALQETLLAAWQGLDGFEARASVRTWLYRIATNRCLNARRSASRRPTKEWDTPAVEPPEPTRFGEIPWLEPYPDSLLEGRDRCAAGPRGPLCADRSHLPGVRQRSSGSAASPARRVDLARRPRIPCQRGGRHARHDSRIGQQRPQAGARQRAAQPTVGR